MSKNNIEKDPMPGKGDLSEKEKLIKLASETGEEEFDLELGSTLLQYDEWKKDAYEKGIDVIKGESLTSYIKRIKAAEKD